MKKFIGLISLLLLFNLVFPQKTYFDERKDTTITGETYTKQIQIYTDAKLVFENCVFKTSESAFFAVNSKLNLTIKNCTFEGVYNSSNGSQGKMVHIYGYDGNVKFYFTNNKGIGGRGIWIQNIGTGSIVEIMYNDWLNIEGRPNGQLKADPNSENSQFVMIQTANSPEKIEVAFNRIQNFALQGKVEDVINFYNVAAVKARPALIHDNLIDGAYDFSPFTNGNFSGTGIQVEGVPVSKNVHTYNNYLVDCSNAPLAYSGCDGGKIYDNVIVSDGYSSYYTPEGNRVKDRFIVNKTWRALLAANPFWNTASTINLEVYGNYIQYPQNVGTSQQIWTNSVECLNNNNCHDNIIVTNGNGAHDKEAVAVKDWWAKVNSLGLTIGLGDNIPPVDTVVTPPPVIVKVDTIYVSKQFTKINDTLVVVANIPIVPCPECPTCPICEDCPTCPDCPVAEVCPPTEVTFELDEQLLINEFKKLIREILLKGLE